MGRLAGVAASGRAGLGWLGADCSSELARRLAVNEAARAEFRNPRRVIDIGSLFGCCLLGGEKDSTKERWAGAEERAGGGSVAQLAACQVNKRFGNGGAMGFYVTVNNPRQETPAPAAICFTFCFSLTRTGIEGTMAAVSGSGRKIRRRSPTTTVPAWHLVSRDQRCVGRSNSAGQIRTVKLEES